MQTQIRLLLLQSDQGLPCLQCHLHLLDVLFYTKATLFKFRVFTANFSSVRSFRNFTAFCGIVGVSFTYPCVNFIVIPHLSSLIWTWFKKPWDFRGATVVVNLSVSTPTLVTQSRPTSCEWCSSFWNSEEVSVLQFADFHILWLFIRDWPLWFGFMGWGTGRFFKFCQKKNSGPMRVNAIIRTLCKKQNKKTESHS